MKKLIFMLLFIWSLFAISVWGVAPSFDFGSCYNPQTASSDDEVVSDLVIAENCSNYGEIDWTGTTLNLTTLGQIVSGEVAIGDGWAYVDTALRPDLDYKATITLNNLSYAYEPTIFRDGVACPNCSSITYVRSTGQLEFTVGGFSNYTVTDRQDFTVFSDTEAYLHDRVYDSIDLGSAYYNDVFHCIVMIFETQDKRLIQTNPEKKKAGRLFSGATSSESELPEIIGYFKIEKGVGNVYYRDVDVIGYTAFLKVIKCNSNSTELIYEEEITPQYKEAFKSAPARGVWFIESLPIAVFVVALSLLIILFLYHQIMKR